MEDKITKTLLSGLKPAVGKYDVNDTELRGFCVRVYPSGEMTFYARYLNAHRRRVWYKVGDAKKVSAEQARKAAQKVLASASLGDDPAAAKRKPENQPETFGQYVEKVYGPWVVAHRKSGAATLSWLKSDRLEWLRKKALTDITPWAVETWLTKQKEEGKKPASRNRELSVIKSALSKAVEWGLLKEHPLAVLKPVRLPKKGRVRYLDDLERKRLTTELDKREEKMRAGRESANKWRRERGYTELPDLHRLSFVDHLKPMVLISLNTGLRRGELFQLRWIDIDFQNRVLRVRAETAKSDEARYIPLNGEALTTLQKWREQTDGRGLVFKGADGKPFTHIKSSWESLLEDAEVEDFRWHDLRHDFASRLVMAGVDLNTVRELLGHADIKMTLRYAHLSPGHMAAAVDRLGAPPPPALEHQPAESTS